jgi:2-polyprenyl-3-methyl-5-hydroxy-6-metoxy-1,4-benzoquinol methylase
VSSASQLPSFGHAQAEILDAGCPRGSLEESTHRSGLNPGIGIDEATAAQTRLTQQRVGVKAERARKLQVTGQARATDELRH